MQSKVNVQGLTQADFHGGDHFSFMLQHKQLTNTRTFILHPKLILQWSEHYITVTLRPTAKFDLVIVIAFQLFPLSTTT